MKNLKNNRQALVEYVLIALVTVIAVSLIKVFGGYLKDSITKTSCELVGEKYEKGANPGEGKCK